MKRSRLIVEIPVDLMIQSPEVLSLRKETTQNDPGIYKLLHQGVALNPDKGQESW
jgi:hypothetical protein